MGNRVTLRALLLVAGSLAAIPAAHAELTDRNPHPPGNYNGMIPPEAGQSYTDNVFGTAIKRVTIAPQTPNSADGGFLTYILPEYSTMSAWNSDSTKFILQHESYFALYDAQGDYLRDLPFEIYASTQPRWARNSPNVLYYLNGNQLKKWNAATNAINTVKTFGEYSSVTGNGESDICFDGDHLVLVGNNRYIFVYTVSTNTKGPVFDTAGRGTFDAVYITPNDNVLVSWHAVGTGRNRGIEMFNKNMVFQRQISRTEGHMDVTRDTNGQELLVLTNSADPQPICDNGIVKIQLANAAATCLLSLDWSLAVHISCPDGNGQCLVDTEAPADPAPNGDWPAYTNELFLVDLDGTPAHRLAHHRSRPRNSYNWEPKATISRDGRKILYTSNFNLQTILGWPTEYGDTYLISVSGTGGGGGPQLVFRGGFESNGTGSWSRTVR